MLNESISIFLFSLIGGIIPALIWLWFWLHEDNKHREPRNIIFRVFILGMFGAILSLFIQYLFNEYFNSHIVDIKNYKIINLIYVIIEEFIKFICAYVIFFRTKIFDEPIDAFIYLMTAALGFAAMENSIHMLKPLIEGDIFNALLNTKIRFIGANILHVASSGLLALFIGYSFCKKPFVRELYIWLGLILAILSHWLFNLFLLISTNFLIFIFLTTWMMIIFIILSLEKVKRIKCEI